jgi:hypothetical protein
MRKTRVRRERPPVKPLEPETTPGAAEPSHQLNQDRESPVLLSQEDEVRFQQAYVHQNGSILADGQNLDLYGAMLIRRDRICASAEGARWTCGQRAYMALRALLAGRPITCSFKQLSIPPKAVCSMDGQDIAQFLLREGWAELPINVTEQAYVEASELAHRKGLGIWGDGPPLPRVGQERAKTEPSNFVEPRVSHGQAMAKFWLSVAPSADFQVHQVISASIQLRRWTNNYEKDPREEGAPSRR